MAIIYYFAIEPGHFPINIALGIPVLLTGVGLFIDSYVREE